MTVVVFAWCPEDKGSGQLTQAPFSAQRGSRAQGRVTAFHSRAFHSLKSIQSSSVPLVRNSSDIISLWNRFLVSGKDMLRFHLSGKKQKAVSLHGFHFRSLQSPVLFRLLLWAID